MTLDNNKQQCSRNGHLPGQPTEPVPDCLHSGLYWS